MQRAPQLAHLNALLLRGCDVHRPDHGGGTVNRHAGADLVKGNALKENFHVAQAADRHAAFAEFSFRFGRIGVIAHQGWQVKRHRQAHVALGDQVLKARVGFFSSAKAGKQPHRPGLATVASGVNATGKRVLASITQVAFIIKIGYIQRRILALYFHAGQSAEVCFAFWPLAQ